MTDRRRNILWKNLLLTGFKPETHLRNLGLDADSSALQATYFRESSKNAGNGQKLMEQAVHHLFYTLNPVETHKSFQNCWPVADRITQAREFRAVAIKWLEQLKKDGHIPNDVTIRKSCFEECRGERYETVLLWFSTHVLQSCMRAIDSSNEYSIPDTSTIKNMSQNNLARESSMLAAFMQRSKHQFDLVEAQSFAAKNLNDKTAKELEAAYTLDVQEKKELQNLLESPKDTVNVSDLQVKAAIAQLRYKKENLQYVLGSVPAHIKQLSGHQRLVLDASDLSPTKTSNYLDDNGDLSLQLLMKDWMKKIPEFRSKIFKGSDDSSPIIETTFDTDEGIFERESALQTYLASSEQELSRVQKNVTELRNRIPKSQLCPVKLSDFQWPTLNFDLPPTKRFNEEHVVDTPQLMRQLSQKLLIVDELKTPCRVPKNDSRITSTSEEPKENTNMNSIREKLAQLRRSNVKPIIVKTPQRKTLGESTTNTPTMETHQTPKRILTFTPRKPFKMQENVQDLHEDSLEFDLSMMAADESICFD